MKTSFKNIGLILTGIVIGISISFAPDIQASTSKLLGGKVTKVVSVSKDGKVIGKGGIINGTTYLPVRTVVNSIDGIEVGRVNSNEVSLITINDPSEIAKQDEETKKSETEEFNRKYNAIRNEIKNKEKEIIEAKNKVNIEQSTSYKVASLYVERYENGQGGSMKESDYDAHREELSRMNEEKSKASATLPRLEKELADLESQLAALK